MKSTSFSMTLIGLSLLLVAVAALGVRLAPAPSASSEAERSEVSQSASTSTLPDLASASYPDGDALKGLGADWTVLQQRALSGSQESAMPGTIATRETLVKTVGEQTQLRIIESNVTDEAVLNAALKKPSVTRVRIAGRDGFVVPMGGSAAATGFLLVGKNTTVLLSDEAHPSWPEALSPQTRSYIATVNVQ